MVWGIFVWGAAAGKSLLSPGFKEGDGDCVGKVEAAVAGTHGQGQMLGSGNLRQNFGGQAARFRAENEYVVGQERGGVIVSFGLAAQGEKTPFGERGAAGIPVGMNPEFGVFVIIQSGAAKVSVIQRKTEWLDQMQFRAGIGGQTDDVAGIGGNFRLEKDNGKHGDVGKTRHPGGGKGFRRVCIQSG